MKYQCTRVHACAFSHLRMKEDRNRSLSQGLRLPESLAPEQLDVLGGSAVGKYDVITLLEKEWGRVALLTIVDSLRAR